MVAGYDAALPGARAAVLSRLLGAIARERLPGLIGRGSGTASFASGAAAGGNGGAIELSFPVEAAIAFAQANAGLAVTVHNRTRDAAAQSDHQTGERTDRTRYEMGTRHDGSDATGGHATGTRRDDTGSHAGGMRHDGSGSTGGHATGIRNDRDDRSAHATGTPADPAPTSSGDARTPATADQKTLDPGTLVRLLWGDVPLAAEVDNSVANLALARAAHPPQTLPTDLGRIEQLVVDGHPLHPCCRTRGGMTVADVLTYAPEHSPVIRLRRLRVPGDRWYGDAPPVLYAHPWQADHLRDRYPWLIDDGETGPGRPLMSLRTVALQNQARHIKTAVDVQMTSAVRTVSPAAINNGPRLSALLRELTADLPISVLAETAGGAVIVDGEPQRHLAYLAREAPRPAKGELIVPLAAMAASPLLLATVHDPYEWWTLLSDRLFAPLVTVLERGVALEAHGQNTLIVLKDYRPHRILYRDFGGVRVSRSRLKQDIGLIGDLPSDDPHELRTKLAAAALSNAAADLVAAFTRHFGTDPAKLWRTTAEAIRNTGTADAAHLLNDPLPVKATTAMRLATDPLDDLWAYLDNPLAAV